MKKILVQLLALTSLISGILVPEKPIFVYPLYGVSIHYIMQNETQKWSESIESNIMEKRT